MAYLDYTGLGYFKGKLDDTFATGEDVATLTEDKANIDGVYEDMTVGNAEQLVATVGIEDQVPYNFRTSGGSIEIGNREENMVVGGTIVWNQLNESGASNTSNGITFTVANGIITASGTASATALHYETGFNFPINHVYYYAGCASGGGSGTFQLSLRVNNSSTVVYDDYGNGTILKNTTQYTTAQILARVVSGQTLSNAKFIPQCFDLTQMFGSTVADYILSLETAHAGAGVAFFRKLFPKPYYAYNTGELMSVNTSAHEMVGFNQWDEEWELGGIGSNGVPYSSNDSIRSKNFCKCVPSTVYYIKGSVSLCWYDTEKNFVGIDYATNNTKTSPANASYFRIGFYGTYGTTYKNDVCINLHWDGSRDGEYEPYTKRTYPLDSSLTLRGIPKLDSNNQLYYDGDTYESDGTVTRRYGVVDLGTLTWYYDSLGAANGFYSTNWAGAVPSANSIAPNIISSIYATNNASAFWNDATDKQITLNNSKWLEVRNSSYTSAASFKTAMSGVYLVYELAEPTSETADTFQNPQWVDDFGTEEYVDDRTIPIPVGHETWYQQNLRAKLEMAPDSPDANGDYVVRHNNGQNTYVPISFPADELPAAPSSNGSYVLTVTVSGGNATYTWEAQ